MDSFLGINRYMLRLTNDCDISEIEIFIKTMECSQYIIGSELSSKGKRHFHVFLVVTKTKDELKALINVGGYKGNKDYNLKVADNNSKVKKYCVKDGDYVYFGVPDDLIKSWVATSHVKGCLKFDEEKFALETKYLMNSSENEDSFGTAIIQLYVKYGKRPTRSHHIPYMDYMQVKKNSEYARTLNANWLMRS